ncbi:MAG: amidohydrolase family protein [Planctomycetota bacterium]|jgi:imidazolonepropionase-like amidohydrolase/Tol biopolymer transport system component
MTSGFRTARGTLIALLVTYRLFLSFAAIADAAGSLRIELKPPVQQRDPNEADENKKWEVSNPPGPTDMVEVDTHEGTWMSLDVSPDGSDIIFDLLGDIYRIPIAGGEAEALTEGVPWDIQPRYSPDGRYIALTSDRGGGDNIWIMDRDGSNLRQVTKEDFRLLNNPVWTPDGQYIAVRKHFTSKRSLGAGEIWLYHVSGGEGVQMTERPNDQKDLGEPAFSPDGRYLFYSQDTTPGPTFEYSKDSNTQIYVIQRLDRQSGEIERFVTGPGGAVRPTPSPNGRYLAFIRRMRFKTTLFLHEIESGAEWPLYNGLDRDMQETWAIHGVYPNIAWTPDSKSIVFWAQGGIQRIDVRTQEVTEIPFHVKTQREVGRALRRPVEVAPDRFKVKVLRWVRVSPNGKRVAFQSLGRIYVAGLPDGEPRRLTRQIDHFEFYPSWSRDSRSIVYTTWDDEELGSVRVISAQGGRGTIVTDKPGHYVEPVFSPDGARIIYRKISADILRSPTWTHERGIYSVPVRGGKPQLVTKKGSRPHFGSENDRLYLLDVAAGDPDDRRALISIELDGSDERTHFVSKNATEFCVSPDGNWTAMRERFNAYIMPFVHSGREIEIGPKTKSVPIRKVSRDAGMYLNFSGDSRRLHWSLGPELYERDLTDAFAFLDGSPEELPEPAVSGIDIGFEVEADVPAKEIALVGARIITMRGDEVIEEGTIIVEKNRIKAIGPKDSVTVSDDVEVIDVSSNTIMPGIIDVHSHGPYGGNGLIPQRNWWRYADLAFGITTNFDPSSDTETIFAAAELQRAGLIVAPRIFSTGRIIYGAAGTSKAEIDSLDDARSHIRRLKAAGAFCVKNYNQPRRDQRQHIIAAARELDMMVVAEGASLFHLDMSLVADGQTGIEHCIPVAKAYDDVIQFFSATGTGITPTLIVGYGGIWGENYWYQHTNVWENQRLLTFVPRDVVDPRSRRRTMAPEEEYNHVDLARFCKQLIDAGGRVQLGAHGQLAGLGAHWELWMLAQGGFTPMEAIRAATLEGARYLGLDGDVGSLEPGKLADLVVLEDNPLENIRHSQSVRYTVLNGRIYDARTMDELGHRPKQDKFYWQMDYSTTR